MKFKLRIVIISLIMLLTSSIYNLQFYNFLAPTETSISNGVIHAENDDKDDGDKNDDDKNDDDKNDDDKNDDDKNDDDKNDDDKNDDDKNDDDKNDDDKNDDDKNDDDKNDDDKNDDDKNDDDKNDDDSKPILNSKHTVKISATNNSIDLIALFEANAYDKEDGNLTDHILIKKSPKDYQEPGNYEIIFEVTDSNNNTISKNARLIIKKSNAPMIEAEDKVVIKATESEVNLIKLFKVSAYDKEDGNITNSVTTDSIEIDYSISGSHTIVFKVTDSDGNLTEKSVELIIYKGYRPFIRGKYIKLIVPTTTNINLVSLFNVTAYDMEDGPLTNSIVVTNAPPTFNIPGKYTIVFTVTDNDNNTNTKTSTLVIYKNQSPTINLKDNVSIITTNQNVNLKTLFNVTANDVEDGNLTNKVVVTSEEINYNIPATHTVTFAVTDSDNNTSSKSATLIIKTSNNPIISSDSSHTIFATDQNVNLKTLFNVTANDVEDGNLTNNVVVTSEEIDYNIPATHTVTFAVTDSDNNTTSKSATLIIETNHNPIISSDSSRTIFATNQNLSLVKLLTVSAIDIEDGNLTNKVVVTSEEINYNIPGTYTVTFVVTDSDNNTSSKSATLTIDTNNKPSLSSNDSHTTFTTNKNLNLVKLFKVTAKDIEDGNLTNKVIVSSQKIDYSIPGTYTVTFAVTDSDNNVSQIKSTLEVVKRNNPDIIKKVNNTSTLKKRFDTPSRKMDLNQKQFKSDNDTIIIISNIDNVDNYKKLIDYIVENSLNADSDINEYKSFLTEDKNERFDINYFTNKENDDKIVTVNIAPTENRNIECKLSNEELNTKTILSSECTCTNFILYFIVFLLILLLILIMLIRRKL